MSDIVKKKMNFRNMNDGGNLHLNMFSIQQKITMHVYTIMSYDDMQQNQLIQKRLW